MKKIILSFTVIVIMATLITSCGKKNNSIISSSTNCADETISTEIQKEDSSLETIDNPKTFKNIDNLYPFIIESKGLLYYITNDSTDNLNKVMVTDSENKSSEKIYETDKYIKNINLENDILSIHTRNYDFPTDIYIEETVVHYNLKTKTIVEEPDYDYYFNYKDYKFKAFYENKPDINSNIFLCDLNIYDNSKFNNIAPKVYDFSFYDNYLYYQIYDSNSIYKYNLLNMETEDIYEDVVEFQKISTSFSIINSIIIYEKLGELNIVNLENKNRNTIILNDDKAYNYDNAINIFSENYFYIYNYDSGFQKISFDGKFIKNFLNVEKQPIIDGAFYYNDEIYLKVRTEIDNNYLTNEVYKCSTNGDNFKKLN